MGNRNELIAALKAAAWQFAAQYGINEAARQMDKVKAEMERIQWHNL